ncbi:MAG: hypothetical protein NWF00_06550 [Candidatus Bathyarchaeota archaeon]|nr:hypothetical protein [Candidatus Bathyarchaeota archaeon]
MFDLDKLLTLEKNNEGELDFSLASSDYSIKPSKETLDSIEKDLQKQIKEDTYPHDSTICVKQSLKTFRKHERKNSEAGLT